MVTFGELKSGITRERDLKVEEKHSVSPTGTPVLSTPMMISLMEIISAELVQPFLFSGYSTVGYEVQVKHKAPAILGSDIKVWAKLLEAEGRKLLFKVRVTDQTTLIGEGLHRRTIVPRSDNRGMRNKE